MTAIDLSRDLELWVDFDSEYWDAQRNQIQDQSGYGRHPTASGGPTVGVEGPNDFEAASFDGTDDYFKTPDFNIDENLTIFLLFKPTNFGNGNFERYLEHNIKDPEIFQDSDDNDIFFRLEDDENNNVDAAARGLTENKWYSFVARYDGSNMTSILDGSVEEKTELSSKKSTGGGAMYIGADDNQSFQSHIELAILGYWNRPLSDAEIEYLNNLTAPRRSNL